MDPVLKTHQNDFGLVLRSLMSASSVIEYGQDSVHTWKEV
jgi:hypothetical protein